MQWWSSRAGSPRSFLRTLAVQRSWPPPGGVLSTLGAQTAHADMQSQRGCGEFSSWPWHSSWACATRSCVRLLVVRLPWPPLEAGVMLGTQVAHRRHGGRPGPAPRKAFVRAPARGAAPMAAARGTLSMLGAQAAHAYMRACATRSCVRRLPVRLSWPSPEACSPCWARRRPMPTRSMIRACATRSYLRLLAVQLPWPPPEARSPCWARRRLRPTRAMIRACATRSCLPVLAVRLPWPPPGA